MLYNTTVVVDGLLDVVFTALPEVDADTLFAIAEEEAKAQCGELRDLLLMNEELISEDRDLPEESTFIVRMDVEGYVYGTVEADNEDEAASKAENAVEDIGELYCADADVEVTLSKSSAA
jgi:hypothetical protein